jgi:fumarate hydratase class II
MTTGGGRVRVERDSMGEIEVPEDALWGASTQRAVENFPISGRGFPRAFVRALGIVKEAAAGANDELGALPSERARAIAAAAREVADGRWDAHFVVDVFQTGSGTSTNMNANEVIARLASRALGGDARVHPNDDVNRSQSSNDVIPTCLHVAARAEIHAELLPALRRLRAVLVDRARAFDEVVKLGRTHLMDATPVRLGQEFAGFARQVELSIARVEAADEGLAELALGGTAVGTGLNCPAGFPAAAISRIERATGLRFREAVDHFEAQGARDAAVQMSAALRGVAVALFKIASDVRLLGSGPRGGLAELSLPAVQPGSSIMPGKVNPVLCEAVTQVAAQVIGNDAAIALGGLSGQLELNTFIPLIIRNLLESIALLARASDLFAERCLAGLEARREHAEALVEESLAMVTAVAPAIGYDAAAAIAREAQQTGRTVREILHDRAPLPREEIDRLLDPRHQTGRPPGPQSG